MSTARAGLPRSAALAVGVAVSAAGASIGLPVATLLAGGLLVAGAGMAVPAGPHRSARVRVMALGLGITLLALRLIAGPAATRAPDISGEIRGPWLATVESMGSPRNGHQVARLRLQLDRETIIVAATLPAFPRVTAGSVVKVDGRLQPPPDDDPYGEYLRRSGASGSLQARSVTLLEASPTATLQSVRDDAGDALRLALPEPEAGLAAGILIGLRERVDRQLGADFATAGVSHVVAISGWNIAIVASLVGVILRGRPRRMVAIVVGGTIVAYVAAAGASPSVVRAAVMAAVVLVARESGRAGRASDALAIASALLLLADPRMIEDAGFRLSVLATAGLLAWATPLGDRIGRAAGGRLPRWLSESLGISLAAQAATLPDVLVTFGRLSLVAPAVNLAVVPLVPIAMAGGAVALLGGLSVLVGAPPAVATMAGLPGWFVLHLMVAIVRTAAAVPFAALDRAPTAAWALAGATAALLVALPVAWRRLRIHGLRARRLPKPASRPPSRAPARRARGGSGDWGRLDAPRRALLVGLAVVAGIASTAVVSATSRETRLTVLDVGQGDAILLESRSGARMLVDGGPDPGRLLLELDARIPPWDRRLDVVVLTHPHEDHVAGLVGLLASYDVRRVYETGMPGPGPGWAAWATALRDGPPRGLLATGAHLQLGEIGITVLWPDSGNVPLAPPDTGTSINNVSIVLLGDANGRRFLLTGDIEQGVDPTLVTRGLPRVDMLKVAHHGSATATTQALLDVAHPTVAVVSVGADNAYGHPAPSMLARLGATGARVLRTDQDGAIEVDLRRDGLVVQASGTRRTARSAPKLDVPASASTVGPDQPITGRPAYVYAIAPRLGPLAEPDRTSALPINPVLAAATGRRIAWASSLGYDPSGDDPGAPRGRTPAALPGPARLAPAAFVRSGGRRGLAGDEGGGARSSGGRRARGRGGPAPRCRQAAAGASACRPPPRRGICGLAGGTWLAGARVRGP